MKTKLAGRTSNEKEARRLGVSEIKILKKQLPRWKLLKGKVLESGYKFPDFKKAWQFTNRVAKLAETQGHHPDIWLSYGAVKIQISTHSAGGLTENDFILAAKINRLG